jgi:hypothetical protein
MLEFLKRLLGLTPKAAEVAAPYKVEEPAPVIAPVVEAAPVVETPAPVIAPVVEAAPAISAAPAQVAKKAATGTGKSMAKKGAEAGVKPARRRKKPAAT